MIIGLQIKHFSLLLWTLLIRSDNINGRQSDARIITHLLEKIIKSKSESNHLSDVARRLATNEYNVLVPEIETAIELKVKELQPMLQDHDYKLKNKRRNNFITEESEETVIITHVPENTRRANIKSYRPTKQFNDTSQKNTKYYKQLRQNVTKLLDKVNAANATKELLTGTFDEMLALLTEQQCMWESSNTTAHLNFGKDTRKSMPELTNIEIMLKQKSDLRMLEFQDTTGNMTEIGNEKIPQLLLHMTKLLNKYKLKCYLDLKQNPGTKNEFPASGLQFRATSSENNEQCDSFIVCSNELTHFLKVTYNSLRNTAISSYRNYTDLLMREVAEKNKTTKEILKSELKALNHITEKECNKIFIEQLKLFKLDKKKSTIANILHIKDFLKVLREKILKSNNIALVLKGDEVCDFFALCNGKSMKKPKGNRRINKLHKFNLPKQYTNVYVEVERSTDEELEDSLPPFGEQILNQGDMISGSDKSVTNAIDQKKYSHVNVTRTTLLSTATKEGTGTVSVSTEYFFK